MQCGFSFELLLIIPLHIPENSFVKTMQCLVYWTNVQIKLLCERGSGVSIVYELYSQNVRVDRIMFGYSGFGYCLFFGHNDRLESCCFDPFVLVVGGCLVLLCKM